MPPSGRKGKTRARRAPATEAHEPSDAETPEAIATPSRGSRKRARGAEAPAPASRNTKRKVKDTRGVDREDTEGTEAQDHSDAETEQAPPGEAEIIAHLKVADRHVNATEDFANDLLEGQENVPGYGKIAGRDWAFIIRKVEVNIGRPEAQERLAVVENGQHTDPSARTIVDIDLGPDRQVSRSHAIIQYDGDRSQWFLVVNGRNGVRIDNNFIKRGTKSYLRNGSVIEIANTQMAFITTATEEGEGPIWDASIIKQAQKSSEEDDDGDDDPRANNHRQAGLSAPRTQLQDSAAYGNDLGSQQRRPHPHSQQANQGAPGTPMRHSSGLMKSSPAANYARGVMMESTETIDYSADGAKDLKPPHSYAQLIGMAILSTHEQQMTLSNIYKWIMANYAFYRFNTGGWQNSIRHNLSLNKAFTKIARRTDEPGKGMKWMIEPTEFDNFVQQGMKGCRRPNPMPGTQSTFGSPTSPMNAMRAGVKKDEETTPPLNAYQPAYSTAMEAYTPERGPKRSINGLGINGDNSGGPEYDYLTRSTPRNNLTAMANAAGSPPALYVNEDSRVGAIDTPFPLRPTQRLAPPSTLKRPSDFIQFSSPAPFWKMDGLAPQSTPWRPYDNSPLKTPFSGFKKNEGEERKGGDAAAHEDEDESGQEDGAEGVKRKASPVIPSSSPPRASSESNALERSPTLSRPATAVAKTLSQLAAASKVAADADEEEENEGKSQSTTTMAGDDQSTAPTSAGPVRQPDAPATRPSSVVNGGQHHSSAPQQEQQQQQASANHGSSYTYSNGSAANGYHHLHQHQSQDDGGEDEGIDLAKGFQSIGSFHQRNHLHMGMGMGTPTAAYGR